MRYYIEYQPFGADAKYRVPTMQNRLGDLTQSPKIILSSGVFRRETASGFYPCSKAVFYVFVFFDSIHDSATMHNLSPEIFQRIEIKAKGRVRNKASVYLEIHTRVFLKYVWGF